MRILKIKKLYFPAVSIVAVVLFLLVLIAISTYRNLNHQKKTALNFVHHQGLVLLSALEAGARTGMMMPMWSEDSAGILIHEIGKNEDVAYIYLIDNQRIILHHSDISKEETRSEWQPQLIDANQIATRLKSFDNGTQVYELAKRFSPTRLIPFYTQHRKNVGKKDIIPQDELHPGSTVVLGMSMGLFEKAYRSDIQHAMIMAAILLVLGSGVFFFIFIIQNYYLVEKTLKQTQDYTRQVVASMANGLLSIDMEGKVISYNYLALKLLGLSESEAEGMNLKGVIDFQAAGINETLTGRNSVIEREINHGKGSEKTVPLALSVSPIPDENGHSVGAVIILRDLTEIKRLEEKVRRSEKLAAIGKLAAGVAHEIRNPLSSIRGFAHFLSHTLQDRPQEREYAETMVKEVDRINSVVTDLLTFARPMKAEPAPVDLTKVVEHTVRLVQEDARSREVEIQMDLSSELNEILLDADQITQALLNLVLNALKAVEPGGKIQIGAHRIDSGKIIKLWVEDDGHGIPPEIIDKIFDPFFTTREKGTGLGLAIVHMIVENHNGKIRVESPVSGKNRGCRFSINIPASEQL
jgi:two-component system sensor histidine kinase HydH